MHRLGISCDRVRHAFIVSQNAAWYAIATPPLSTWPSHAQPALPPAPVLSRPAARAPPRSPLLHHQRLARKRELAADLVDHVELADIPARRQALERYLELHGHGVRPRARQFGGPQRAGLEGLGAFAVRAGCSRSPSWSSASWNRRPGRAPRSVRRSGSPAAPASPRLPNRA